jgi:hypothetical protein
MFFNGFLIVFNLNGGKNLSEILRENYYIFDLHLIMTIQ